VEPSTPPPPPAPAPSGTPPPLPRRGWWARNWKWFVPTGCLSLIALFFAFIAVIVFAVFGAIKSSDAYKTAVGRAKADPRVSEAIGTPIKEGWYVSGNTEVSGGSGKTDMSIPISGPKGSATIYAVATKFAGDWQYSKLLVKVERTGEMIDLTDKTGEDSEE
jgi:hypothetical protein